MPSTSFQTTSAGWTVALTPTIASGKSVFIKVHVVCYDSAGNRGFIKRSWLATTSGVDFLYEFVFVDDIAFDVRYQSGDISVQSNSNTVDWTVSYELIESS